MNIKITILALFCLGLFASCSLQINLDYRADESGKIAVQMKTENNDMLQSMLGQFSKDSSGATLPMLDSIPDIQNSLLPKMIAGIFGFQNPEIKELDNGTKELGLDFTDITKLNGNHKKRDKSKVFFKKYKNGLAIYFPKDIGAINDSKDSNPMMGLFTNMINTELNLNFERKVKKSNYKKIAFSEDRKQAKLRFNLADFEELSGKKITFCFEK